MTKEWIVLPPKHWVSVIYLFLIHISLHGQKLMQKYLSLVFWHIATILPIISVKYNTISNLSNHLICLTALAWSHLWITVMQSQQNAVFLITNMNHHEGSKITRIWFSCSIFYVKRNTMVFYPTLTKFGLFSYWNLVNF